MSEIGECEEKSKLEKEIIRSTHGAKEETKKRRNEETNLAVSGPEHSTSHPEES
jgi:hypothetical protein